MMNIALNIETHPKIESYETILYLQNTELSQTNWHDHSRVTNEGNADNGGKIREDGMDLKETWYMSNVFRKKMS